MELSSEDDKLATKVASLSSLLILMLSIFAVVTIYRFLFSVSEDWVLIDMHGLTIFSRTDIFDLVAFIANLFILIVLFVLIYAVPRRKTVIKGTFLLTIPFFLVAYLGNLTGAGIYFLVAVYFLPSNVSFSFGPVVAYLLSPLSFSVTLAFVCIGAVFARKSGNAVTET